VGLELYDLEIVMKQLLKRPSRLVTPLSTVTLTRPIREAVQVPITPANIAQVGELFQRIIEGERQLNLAIVLQIQKLCKGASKAIANVSIQRTTNIDLIEAKLTKKKRANRKRGKNYAFGRVLNEETIKEREAFVEFKEYWTQIPKCQPNLLIPLKKKKKAVSPTKKATPMTLQLSPSIMRLFSLEKATAQLEQSPLKSLSKALAPTEELATRLVIRLVDAILLLTTTSTTLSQVGSTGKARKALVAKKVPIHKRTTGQAKGSGPAIEPAVEPAVEAAVEAAVEPVVEPATATATVTATARTKKTGVAKPVMAQPQAVEPVIQTRSRRRTVKRVIFEAGIN
jgi:hypothetical protein